MDREQEKQAFDNFKRLVKQLDNVASPFPAPCNLVLGQGYGLPLACGATGKECHVPCKKVENLKSFSIRFPHAIDFGVKRSNVAFLLTRMKDPTKGWASEGVEFTVLREEMLEHGFTDFPVLAISGEYRGRSKLKVMI